MGESNGKAFKLKWKRIHKGDMELLGAYRGNMGLGGDSIREFGNKD